MRLRRWWLAAGLIGAIATVPGPATVAALAPGPEGLVAGGPHVVRFRPQLLSLPPAPRTMSARARAEGTALVATCDPAQVGAGAPVPTTRRADGVPGGCVVLPVGVGLHHPPRALLGPARIAGDAVESVELRADPRGRDTLVVRLTDRGAALLAASPPEVAALPVAVDVDGVVVGTAVIRSDPDDQPDDGATAAPSLAVITGRGLDGDKARAAADDIDQARSEQLVELAARATMTRRARELLARAAARLDDKAEFARHCPNPEPTGTLILGCYDGQVFVLRVDRPDLAGVMTVTAAHEALHVAYDGMTPTERKRVVAELDAFMQSSGDARISELLGAYEGLQLGSDARENELHSLVGTQVRTLPPALERHYRRYFRDRSALVDAFDAYERVFDDLQARYDALQAEAQALESRLTGLRGEIDAAGAEADRLSEEITALRAQGRIAESNGLVGPQNEAANRANSLATTFNGLVDEYNAKVAELNTLGLTINDTYNEIRPVPVGAPAPA